MKEWLKRLFGKKDRSIIGYTIHGQKAEGYRVWAAGITPDVAWEVYRSLGGTDESADFQQIGGAK